MTVGEAMALLGLRAGFTQEDLTKAYRSRSLSLHPDRGGDQKAFERCQNAKRVCQGVIDRRTHFNKQTGKEVTDEPRKPPRPAPLQTESAWTKMKQQTRDNYSSSQEGSLMAMMKETKFVSQLNQGMEAAGAMCLKVHGHAMQEKGWPDLQVYSPLFTGHLEAKVDRNKLEPLQADRIKELRRRGTVAWCIRQTDREIVLEDVDQKVISVISRTELEELGQIEQGQFILQWLAGNNYREELGRACRASSV